MLRGLMTIKAVDLAGSSPKALSTTSIEPRIGRNKILAKFQLQYSYTIVTQKCAAWVHNSAVECQYLTLGQSRTTFSKQQFPLVCVLFPI